MEDNKNIKEPKTILISKLSPRILAVLQEQVSNEQRNQQIYLCMKLFCNDKSYFGAEKFYTKQSSEETEHRNKVLSYLIDKKMPYFVPSTDRFNPTYIDLTELIYKSLEVEKGTTDEWKKIAQVCFEEKDFQTLRLAQEFLDIQVEEETTFINLIDRLNIIGICNANYYLDVEMGKD